MSQFPLLILVTGAALSAQVVVQGHVFSSDGSRLSGATVTIEGPSKYVEVTESGTDPGHYASPELAAGSYTVTAKKDGFAPKIARPVVVNTEGRVVDFVLDRPDDGKAQGRMNGGWTLLVVLLFLASIWLVRWHNIARPNRELLKSEIQNAAARFESDTGAAPVGYLANLLVAASDSIKWHPWHTTCDFLFWSRGQEITGWSRIHEFQRASIGLLATASPLETIRARLQAIELDLLDVDKTHAKTIASNIKDALDAKPPLGIEVLRALLVEAATYQSGEDVNTFAQLVGWQTKAVWLAGVGCTLLVVLAYAVGNPVLFIAGASGGYLSRLGRTLKRADVPTDYGASWTTLFLSPIVGALSGWFGILLIVVLADSKMQVLGAAFQAVRWCCPLAPFTLGLAFALGFSERLFDGIISSLDDKVDSDKAAATKPQQPSSGVNAGGGAPRAPQAAPPTAAVENAAPEQEAAAESDPKAPAAPRDDEEP
jgi:hypothetical protein